MTDFDNLHHNLPAGRFDGIERPYSADDVKRLRGPVKQQAEFAAEVNGYTATKHQREVVTGYFDAVSMAITDGRSSTTAMRGSTEHAQFKPAAE